jgi:hypothetical protein
LETKINQEPNNSTYKENLTQKKLELVQLQEDFKKLLTSPTQNNETNASKGIS